MSEFELFPGNLSGHEDRSEKETENVFYEGDYVEGYYTKEGEKITVKGIITEVTGGNAKIEGMEEEIPLENLSSCPLEMPKEKIRHIEFKEKPPFKEGQLVRLKEGWRGGKMGKQLCGVVMSVASQDTYPSTHNKSWKINIATPSVVYGYIFIDYPGNNFLELCGPQEYEEWCAKEKIFNADNLSRWQLVKDSESDFIGTIVDMDADKHMAMVQNSEEKRYLSVKNLLPLFERRN